MTGEVLVLDSNLLVLLVVGTASPEFIGRHKNTKIYSKSDYHLLKSIVAEAKKVLTIPNILTETSNLVRQFGEPARSRISESFNKVIGPFEEQYIASHGTMTRSEFNRFGLTDCAILEGLQKSYRFITVDLELWILALKHNYWADNFNHLRDKTPGRGR